MAYSPRERCCRSTPRCRSCPVFRALDQAALRGAGATPAELPPHLRGVPSSLRKYEPLLKRSWERQPAAAGLEDPAGEPAA